MILKGKKVILRQATVADAPRYVKWFNDPRVNKFLNVRQITLKEEHKWIKSIPKDKSRVTLAIDTLDGNHIGSVTVEDIHPRNKRATFGIMIGDRKYWSKGYGGEASALLIDYAFKKLKLHRLDLDVYDYNKRAIALYEKLGFKKEAILREHNFYKGKFRDVVYMGLLKREWKNK